VLRAAHDAGALRVVLTSSFAAIGYTPKPGAEFTEPSRRGDEGILQEKERREVFARAAQRVSQAQGEGLLDVEFDPEMLHLALAAISIMPYLLPQLTRLITGEKHLDPRFQQRQSACWTRCSLTLPAATAGRMTQRAQAQSRRQPGTGAAWLGPAAPSTVTCQPYGKVGSCPDPRQVNRSYRTWPLIRRVTPGLAFLTPQSPSSASKASRGRA
jgi:hypothetical protein